VSRTAAVVPAAGSGERLGDHGGAGPKALRLLGGEPMVAHAVRALAAGGAELVVVAAPPGLEEALAAVLVAAAPAAVVRVVTGGPRRRDSVAAALAVLPDDVDVVLVHDAARPLAPAALVARVTAAVRGGADAVVPALGLVDTVKEVDLDGHVVATPHRAALRAVQTPQGFRRAVLAAAYAGDGDDATDDAGLVERAGGTVCLVEGDEEAFKVTRRLDLVLAQAVLAARAGARP